MQSQNIGYWQLDYSGTVNVVDDQFLVADALSAKCRLLLDQFRPSVCLSVTSWSTAKTVTNRTVVTMGSL